MTQDAVRIRFPKNFSVESLPAGDNTTFEKSMGYIFTTESTPDSFTVRRNYILGDIIFQTAQYPAFRTFYSKIENKDHESVVLTAAPVTAKASPTAN